MRVHIDISEKFEHNKTIGIAWTTEDKKLHKGTALSGRLVKKLKSKYGVSEDYEKLYAILVYLILKNDIGKTKEIVICNDYKFSRVKVHLSRLFSSEINYDYIDVMSIREYRNYRGDYFESFADSLAKLYRKKGLRQFKKNVGKKLNFVDVKYKEIIDLWKLI
jgi:hypothetical protein